jgi:DNA invertase Pin-like site-specific DNA recombinase
MVLNMILVIAQWERETISERTSEAMEHVVAKGQRAGRLRFGFDLGDDGKTLIPNKREQEAIILMRELRSDGWTLREIADELDRLEIRTKDGKPWAHSSINYVLKSKPILSVDSAA